MKLILSIIFFTLLFVLYVQPVWLMRAYHVISSKKDLNEPLLDIRFSKFNQIDGVYDFQCKSPELYDLGVSVDKKTLISPFNDNELAKTFIPEFKFYYELFIDGKSLGLNFVEKFLKGI
jgi:hypothetical protein